MSDEKIGALWINESKAGKKYMSGSVTIEGVETKIILFKNDSENPKAPAYNILKSKPRPDGGEAIRKVFVDDAPDSDIPF